MVCSLGYLSAENINLCVCACQNILLSVCVLAVLSSLPVEDNSVLYYFSTFLFLCARTQTHTQALHIPLSPFPISEHTQAYVAFIRADLQYFYWMTAAPANRLQRQDISRNLTFMGLVFSLAPILHGTHLAFSVLVSSRTPVRKSLRFWLSCCRIFKERKKQKGDLNPFWGWPIQPSGGTAGEACISTCTWLAHCLRRTPMLASTLSSSSPEKLPNNN